MTCARRYIPMIGEPRYVCERPDGHDGYCHGRARERSGELAGREAHWPTERSYTVAGEVRRAPGLLDAGKPREDAA